MSTLRSILKKISDLKAKVLKDSISPNYLGSILEEMLFYSRSDHSNDDDLSDVYYSIEIDSGGDGYLAWGESMTLSCRVLRSWHDVTDKVTQWQITRDSGNRAEDDVWNQSDKALSFAGEITLTLSADESDIMGDSSTFTVHAAVDETLIEAEIII